MAKPLVNTLNLKEITVKEKTTIKGMHGNDIEIMSEVVDSVPKQKSELRENLEWLAIICIGSLLLFILSLF